MSIFLNPGIPPLSEGAHAGFATRRESPFATGRRLGDRTSTDVNPALNVNYSRLFFFLHAPVSPPLRSVGPNAGFASVRAISPKGGGSRTVANPACAPSDRGGVPGLRKIDIQSRVLIHPFSASFGPRNGREMAIRPTKNRSD